LPYGANGVVEAWNQASIPCHLQLLLLLFMLFPRAHTPLDFSFRSADVNWAKVKRSAVKVIGSEGASPHEKHLREERNAL